MMSEADSHLRLCSSCRDRFDQLLLQNGGKISSLVLLTQAFGREEISSPIPRLVPSVLGFPSFEMLAGYVDGTLSSDENTRFEEAFAHFPTLSQEVEDLRKVRRELKELQQSDPNPLAVPPMHVAKPTPSQDIKPRRSWRRFLMVPLQTLSATGVVAMLLFVFVISPQNRQLLEQEQYQQQLLQAKQSNQQLTGEKKRLYTENRRLQNQSGQMGQQSQKWKQRWEAEHTTRVEEGHSNEQRREREAREYAARIDAVRRDASMPTSAPTAAPTPKVVVGSPTFEPSGVASWVNGQLLLSSQLPYTSANTRSADTAPRHTTSQRPLLVGFSSNLPTSNPTVKRLLVYYQDRNTEYIRFVHAGENSDVELTLGWQGANKAQAGIAKSGSSLGQIGYYLRLARSQKPLFRQFVPAKLDGDVTDEGEAILETALENYVVQQKLMALSASSPSGRSLLHSANVRLYRVTTSGTRPLVQSNTTPTFRLGEKVEFQVNNSTKYPLYIVGLWLSQNGQVLPLPKAVSTATDTTSNNQVVTLKPNSRWTFGPYKITPPTGLEHFQFLLSTQPIRWNEEIEEGLTNNGRKSMPSVWAAQTFTISVK